MEKLEYKKSAVDLTDLALGIVVLGIVVVVGANILIKVRDTRLPDLPILTTTNESIPSGTTFDNIWFKAVTSCINQSDNTAVTSANYTTTVDSFGHGTLTRIPATYAGYDMNCTYTTYDVTQADYSLADDAATGLGEYGNWFSIIVIVGVAAVILGLIFMAFGKGAGQVGGGSY
jgi:hypothetical protein